MFYAFVGHAVRLILAILTRCSVEGMKHVPREGSILLISNHLNLIDPPVLGALLPRRVVFMAKDELFHTPVVGWVVRWYGAFSVKRGQTDRQALRNAVEVLQHGGVLGMFPEGHRSKTGKIGDVHPGAALIALMSGATVLPVAITGTDRVRTPFSLLTRPRITVRVGEPFVIERDRSRKEPLQHLADEMMWHVAALLPAERRGRYAEPCTGSGATG